MNDQADGLWKAMAEREQTSESAMRAAIIIHRLAYADEGYIEPEEIAQIIDNLPKLQPEPEPLPVCSQCGALPDKATWPLAHKDDSFHKGQQNISCLKGCASVDADTWDEAEEKWIKIMSPDPKIAEFKTVINDKIRMLIIARGVRKDQEDKIAYRDITIQALEAERDLLLKVVEAMETYVRSYTYPAERARLAYRAEHPKSEREKIESTVGEMIKNWDSVPQRRDYRLD